MTPQGRVNRLGIHLDHLDDPGAAVEAAIAAEQLGYDHVVVPEHSEVVAWDPWMLLSWIAARTERIGLVTAGLDTLRSPTVLARAAAASLDLLAGGRVVLGLANGWMAHLGSGGPDRLIQHLRMLDQHAAEAGRDPRELQRVVTVSGRLTDSDGSAAGFLSGPSERWVSDLAPLIVHHGVTTLVLRVDAANPIEQLERFAREVAPGLDEAARQGDDRWGPCGATLAPG